MSAINPAVPGRLTRIAQGGAGSPRVSGDGRLVVWNQMVDGTWQDAQDSSLRAIYRLERDA